MPKKRPITKYDIEHLKKTVHEGYSSLLGVRSILAGHFKQDEKLMRNMERLVSDYADFKKASETEFMKRVN